MKIVKSEPLNNQGSWDATLSIQDKNGFNTSVEIKGVSSKEEALEILDTKEREINERLDSPGVFQMP